ncbi:MAG TPA: hypothetical protein VG755_31140 [Nannocystaceae bacterium]|nr:hypothetical protein [Nannocystaceae bacterium]
MVAAWLAWMWLATWSRVDEPVLALDWNGAEGCPDMIAVRERLESAIADGNGTIAVVARVTHDDARWRLVLDVRGPAGEGTRELEAESCDALVESAAVVVKIAAHDTAIVPSAPPPATVIETTAAPKREPVVATRAEGSRTPAPPSPAPRRRLGWNARIGGGIDVGSLPRWGGTLRAGTGPSWQRAMLEVSVVHALARTTDRGDYSGRFRMTAGSVRGGPVLRRRALVLAGLFGVEIGAVHGKGVGMIAAKESTRLWIAAEGGVELGWRFAGGWTLVTDASLVIPWLPRKYEVAMQPVGKLGPAGGRFGLALRWESLPAMRIRPRGGQP